MLQVCKYCGAKFIYKKMLNAHIRKEHSENEPSRKASGIEKDPGPFVSIVILYYVVLMSNVSRFELCG